MDDYVNKIAVVTGSSSGIGAALAKELAKRGCRVIGLARRMEKLQVLSNEICGSVPGVFRGTFHPYQCDITDEEQINSIFEVIQKNHGIPSILINNAGVAILKPFQDLEGESFDQTVNTNVKGLILATKHAMKLMSNNGIPGHILNLNSIAGHYLPLSDDTLTYAGSKHMARIISEGIREMITKHKWNIKISNVSPGIVQTEGVKDVSLFSSLLPLTVDDVVKACMSVLDTPPNVLISELIIMPIHQYVKELPHRADETTK